MTITTISLATTSVRGDKDGNTQERTEWHRVKFFGKLGEIAGNIYVQGSQCYIEGSIRYDKFTGQDGQERYVTEIVADEMQMLGGRSDGGGMGGAVSAHSVKHRSVRITPHVARPVSRHSRRNLHCRRWTISLMTIFLSKNAMRSGDRRALGFNAH